MALEVTVEAFRAWEEAQRRSRLFNAASQSLGIVAVGVSLYAGWFAYRFAQDANISLRNSMGSIAEIDFPPLSPYLATDECADALWTLWGGPQEDPGYGIKYRLVDAAALFPGLASTAAKQVRDRMPEPASYKMAKWRDVSAKIDAETGAFHGYSGEYYWALKVQADLIKVGIIDASAAPKQHPVDAVAGFVTGNKWFWGAVLGAAAVPPLAVARDILREQINHERKENL